MTPNEKTNENIKLAANWLNTIATAIMTAGAFVPIAQFIFNVLPATTDPNLVMATGLICIGVAMLIHLTGHMVLRSLQ
jgi:hypothetical protein